MKNIAINNKVITFKFVYDFKTLNNMCNMSLLDFNLKLSSLLVSEETKNYLNSINCNINAKHVTLNEIKSCPVIESQIQEYKSLANIAIEVTEQDQFQFTLKSSIFPSGSMKMKSRGISKSLVNSMIKNSLKASPIERDYYDNHNRELTYGGNGGRGTVYLTPDYYRIITSVGYYPQRHNESVEYKIKYEDLESTALIRYEGKKQ